MAVQECLWALAGSAGFWSRAARTWCSRGSARSSWKSMRRRLEQVKMSLNLMKIAKEMVWKGVYPCAEANSSQVISSRFYSMPLGFIAKIVMDNTRSSQL